jgi:hypothetical protein
MGGLFNDENQKQSGLTLILLTQPLRSAGTVIF